MYLKKKKIGSFSHNKTEYFIEPQEEQQEDDGKKVDLENSKNFDHTQTSIYLQAHLIFRKAFNLDENHSPHCSLLGKKNQINNNFK